MLGKHLNEGVKIEKIKLLGVGSQSGLMVKEALRGHQSSNVPVDAS